MYVYKNIKRALLNAKIDSQYILQIKGLILEIFNLNSNVFKTLVLIKQLKHNCMVVLKSLNQYAMRMEKLKI